ncbi:PepSY domain-containing protein [Nitrospina gracilis]|nr:PepSY domain-containing protein [Nitrospina gracilis]
MHFLTLAHRWMGVFLCSFFACWFISGAILIYHPFPSLSQSDRIARSSHIDLSQLSVSPKEAVQIAGGKELDRLRLIDLEGRPVYVLHGFENDIRTMDAKSGKLIDLLHKNVAGKIAEKFSETAAFKVEGPLDYDQWIVPNRYDPYRPFFRVSLKDRNETVLYVSARTGEVLQKTESSERAWNYMGAVTHWIYPTALRKNWVLWDQVVWWLSLFGVITTVAGLWLGIIRWRGFISRKNKDPASPFNGWLRAHHILGLFAGIFVLTWVFSGWLSMDHGRFFSKPNPKPDQVKKFRSISMAQAVENISLEALTSLDSFSEGEIFAMGGKTFVMIRNAKEQKLFKPFNSNSLSAAEFKETEVVNAVKEAWPKSKIQTTERPGESDIYGNLREGSLPSNTLRVVLADPLQTWVHIDMESGQIVSVMDRSRRQYRWLFNGLHSLDFPGLANHRPAWDIVIFLLLGLGFLFCITGVVIGMKRIFG